MPYLRKREQELPEWFNNFNTALPEHAATLAAVTAGDLATVAADTEMVNFSINHVEMFKSEQRAWVEFKNTELYGDQAGPTPTIPTPPSIGDVTPVPPGIIRRTRDLVLKIKADPNYTTAIGEDLRIIGEELTPPVDPSPEGSKATALPSHEVRIQFKKASFSGVVIESRRGGGDWEFLAIDLHSPYLDTRPPLSGNDPEKREYRLRYLDKDDPVGQFSDTITVSTVV